MGHALCTDALALWVLSVWQRFDVNCISTHERMSDQDKQTSQTLGRFLDTIAAYLRAVIVMHVTMLVCAWFSAHSQTSLH